MKLVQHLWVRGKPATTTLKEVAITADLVQAAEEWVQAQFDAGSRKTYTYGGDNTTSILVFAGQGHWKVKFELV